MFLLLVGLLTIVIAILLSTFIETLWWWYLWDKQSRQQVLRQASWRTAIVFLTGISDYGAETLQPEQIHFLHALGRRYPVDVLLAEPFPYERLTARQFVRFDIWRYVGFKEPPFWVWSLHNFWQMLLTSWFERVYGAGVARCLVNRMGLPQARPNPTLVFICGSAGAALALAAASDLKELWQIRLIIIAYGGVFGAARGFNTVDVFYQLTGTKDGWAKLAALIVPGRCLTKGSFARAKAEDRFREQQTGPHAHFGLDGYLSDCSSESGGKSYRTLTLETIFQLRIWEDYGFNSST